MGAITDFTFEHPDEVLMALGFFGGFGLATASLGLLTGVVGGLAAAVFTFVTAHLEPHDDPTFGPHQ